MVFLNISLSRCLLLTSAVGLAPGIDKGSPGDSDVSRIQVQKLWLRGWAGPETVPTALLRKKERDWALSRATSTGEAWPAFQEQWGRGCRGRGV